MGKMRSNDNQKVIVVGIPKDMDDEGLSELFSSYGTIADAKVVLDKNTKESRGFGFVTFAAASAMQEAIKGMHQKKLDNGRILNVRALVSKDKHQSQRAGEMKAKEVKSQAKNDEANTDQPKPCWLLRKGKCTKGDACPYSHETKAGDFGSCFEFVQKGSCRRGDKCNFHHPNTEDTESEVAKPVSAQTEGEEKPKRYCFAYQRGRCHRGPKCMFLHEKQPQSAVTAQQKPANASEDKAASSDSKKRKRQEDMEVPVQTHDESDSDGSDSDTYAAMKAAVQKRPTTNTASESLEEVATSNMEGIKEPEQPSNDTSSAENESPPQQKKRKQAVYMKQEKMDLGSAFDDLSDDETQRADREKAKAAREKAQAARKAKRAAKKNALSRLLNDGEFDA